jgi:hypothetical protein
MLDMLKVNMSIGIVCMVNYTAISRIANNLDNLTTSARFIDPNVTANPISSSDSCSGVIVNQQHAVKSKIIIKKRKTQRLIS